MAEIVAKHKRPDGKRGFTFRDLCPKLHVAAESLRAAILNPGRLSVSSVVALAELMGEEPMVVLSDILAEMKSKSRTKKVAVERPKGIKPKAEAPARSSKPKPEAKPAAQKAGK